MNPDSALPILQSLAVEAFLGEEWPLLKKWILWSLTYFQGLKIIWSYNYVKIFGATHLVVQSVHADLRMLGTLFIDDKGRIVSIFRNAEVRHLIYNFIIYSNKWYTRVTVGTRHGYNFYDNRTQNNNNNNIFLLQLIIH